MIVVDEQISYPGILAAIGHWYPGTVLSVRDFKPHGRILDPEIPGYLLQLRQPTFVTINYGHFPPDEFRHARYCIVRFKLKDEEAREVPELLRALLRQPEFDSKAKRMGKVISWTKTQISYVER